MSISSTFLIGMAEFLPHIHPIILTVFLGFIVGLVLLFLIVAHEIKAGIQEEKKNKFSDKKTNQSKK